MNTLVILALLLFGNPPRTEMLEAPSMGGWRNARIETRTLTGSLSDAIRAAAPGRDPAWVAYGVRGIEKRMVCCWSSVGQWKNRPCRSGCTLEGRKDDGGFSISDDGECSGSRDLRVLFRVADGKIGKIRALSDVCPLDAGNLRVVWLEGVDGAKSAAFLEERIATTTGRLSRRSRCTGTRRPMRRCGVSWLPAARASCASRPHSGSATPEARPATRP
jgi:hypothetical protein